MKKTKLLIGTGLVAITAIFGYMDCDIETEAAVNTEAYTQIGAASSEQEGTTLHAWNWSMNEIKAKMPEIAAAGYTSVQTSPMQPQKDYWEGNSVNDGWWKLYQPLGFCIATKNNAIGTKSELKAMCDEADKYGIKVIVDVVSNHLSGSATQLDSAVKEYEPAIYGTNGNLSGGALLHTATGTGVYDSDQYYVTHGNIGMPDLDTGNKTVQARVASLLKEYIDVGVDGFRFDAAKHIETPSDYSSSDYWPSILNEATAYAKSTKGFTPYYYGEILNTPGANRYYSYYTPYMSVIDNCTGNYATKNINNYNAAGAAQGSNYNSNDIGEQIAADHAITWAESHDTWADGSSAGYSQQTVNKSYALMASRNDSMALYFARPANGSTTKLGEADTTAWKSAEVVAANKFHNYFEGSGEWLASDGDFVMNVRYNDKECGMVLVNVGAGACNAAVPTVMKDGKYTDQITGNTFTVSGGRVSGQIGNSGVAVLFNPTSKTSTTTTTTTETISRTIDMIDCANASGFTATGKKLAELTTGDANITVKATKTGTSSSKLYGTVSSGKWTAANWRFYSSESGEFTVSSPYTIKSITVTYAKSNATNAYLAYGSKTVTSGTAVAVNANSATFTAKSKTSTNYNCQIKKLVVVYEKTGTVTTPTTPVNNKTIYFVDYQKWGKVNAYVWGDTEMTSWPGTSMTKTGTNANGYSVYSFTYDANKYENVIFNDGTNQTEDIELLDSVNMYYLSGTKSGTKYVATADNYANVDQVGYVEASYNVSTTTTVTTENTTTIDMINCANASGLTATGKKLASLSTGDSNVTVSATTVGTSSSKLYGTVSSGKWTAANWRFYSTEKGAFTITCKYKIKSITITYTKSNATNAYLAYGSTTVTSGSAVTIGATSAVFTAKSKTTTNYNCQIKKIVVVYDTSSTSSTTTAVNTLTQVKTALGITTTPTIGQSKTTTTSTSKTTTATNKNTIVTKTITAKVYKVVSKK